MRLNRTVLLGMLMPLALTLGASPASAAFSNVVQLVLQQGVIPTTNGVNVVGAPAYTGAVDTYVWKETPDTAYGAASVVLFGGHKTTGSTNATRGYMKFDFAAYLPLPANAKVVDAVLYVVGAGLWSSGSSSRFGYSTGTWDTNLTWNGTKPGQQDLGYVYESGWGVWPSNLVQFVKIGSVVQGWHSGILPNYGIQLYGREDGGNYQGYRVFSSDAAEITNRPKLVIDYVLTGNDVPAPRGWGGTTARNRMIVTNGPTVIEDTYISQASKTNNYSAADSISLRTRNGVNACRFALLKTKLNDPGMPLFAKSTDPFMAGEPRLMNARLQISTTFIVEYIGLWSLTQSWDVATVTWDTRDGANPWAQVWTNDVVPMRNSGTSFGNTSFNLYMEGACWSYDITTTIQAYIDGTLTNNGFVLGQTGADYDNILALTEFAAPHMRPTLLLQVWYPLQSGTVILLK